MRPHIKRGLIALALVALAQGRDHAQRIPKARITPLPASEWSDDHRVILGSMGRGDQTIDVFKTCLRNVELCRSWMPFTRYLLSTANSVPRREREMLILRTSYLCRADYDWAHHVPSAKSAGLSDDEILRIAKGADASGWSRFDATLLRAVDELHRDQFITGPTWTALAERYNEKQLMDVIYTVGQYTMVSMFLNSAGVQLEPGMTGLPQ